MIRRIALAWVAAAVVIIVAISVTAFFMLEDKPARNARTVSTAIQELTGGQKQEESTPTTNYGVSDLLDNLGLPRDSLSQFGLAKKPIDYVKRVELEKKLQIAVETGELSEQDSESVLKAFDIGVVDTAREQMVLEDNSNAAS